MALIFDDNLKKELLSKGSELPRRLRGEDKIIQSFTPKELDEFIERLENRLLEAKGKRKKRQKIC